MKILILIIFVFIFSINEISAQRCANVAREIEGIQDINKFRGKVFNDNGETVSSTIEIYKIFKSENELSLFDITKDKKPIRIIKTNQNGHFFLKNLPFKSYVLKVGASKVSGYNCTWLKIKMSKNGSGKPLEIKLTLGT